LGQLCLWDGIDLVTAMLAMFAIPEMIALGVKGGSIAGQDAAASRYRLKEVIGGMGDIITHRWLTLRTSLIGAVIGTMPGLGGDAASWICYGHAMQSSKAPERFGKGAVEGVIGPETANNAKEGGSLIPTLFFGVPGSSGMALLLGAFVMLGIQPGPNVLLNQLDLVWTLIWALVLSNIFAVAVFLLFAQQLSLIAHLRGGLLIPIVFCLAVLGSLLSSGGWHHLIILMVFGVLGYGLQRYEWPRPPFVIGIVMGSIAETSLNKAMAIWGPAFFLRPGAMILIVIIIASVAFYFWRRSKFRGGLRGE
jgi:TctA family transporter